MNIYKIYEEDFKFNVVIDKDTEASEKFDAILNNNLELKNESIIKENGKYSKFKEIKKIYDKGEKKIGKIKFVENGKKITGSGFFLEIDNNKFNLPFKRVLFTNNHVINEEYLKNHEEIEIQINDKYYEINIKLSEIYLLSGEKKLDKSSKKRKIFTEPMYDYTCIEILDNDFKEEDIDFFKLGKKLEPKDIPTEIYVLQFPQSEELSFSFGQISKAEDSYLVHTASTEGGSSGSPIIKREDHSVIGLHFAGNKIYNLGFKIEDILINIMNIYSDIDIIQNYIEKEKLIKSNSLQCNSINKYRVGKIGVIFNGNSKELKKDIFIISINLVILYEMKNKNINYFSEEIKKNIEICRLLSNNVFDYYINGNNINIVVEKYKTKFNDYFEEKNKDFDFEEIKNLFSELKAYMEIIHKNNIYLGTININNILISKINGDKIKYQFLFYYDKMILSDNKLFLSPEILDKKKDCSKSDLWSVGALLHFILSKEKYSLNFYTSNQFIDSIKNNSFLFDSENIDNNLLSLIQFLLKYEINERITWDNFIKFSLKKNNIDKKIKALIIN